MTVKRFKMPDVGTSILNALGEFEAPWHRYLGGVETLSSRVAANQTDIDASPTNEQLATAHNALLAKLKAAKLMESG